MPGAASLVDLLDLKVLIILKGGRNLVGFLRSFDQYLNLVLEDTIERFVYGGERWKFLKVKCVLI